MTDPATTSLGAAALAVIRRAGPLVGATLLLTVIYYWLGPHRDASFFVPPMIFAGLWLLVLGRHERADRAAMVRLREPWTEGRWTAVCGTAVPLDDAPGDVLAVRFEVYDTQARGSRSGGGDRLLRCRYDGFYLVPFGVDTGEGAVPVRGFPDLIATDDRPIANDILVAAKAAATPTPRWLPKSVARELVLSGVADRVQISLKYGNDPETARGKLVSRVLRPGDEVCIFGVWRGGTLCASPARPRGLPVYFGPPDEVARDLGLTSKILAWLGGILLAGAAALATWTLV